MHSRSVLSMFFLLAFSLPASAQYRKEAVIIFKDGFFLSGKVVEKKDFIIDPASGQSVTIPLSGGLINLDDMVRRMFFIPGQLQEVLEKKEIDRNLLNLTRYANTSKPDKILPGWRVVDFPAFNSKWERALKVHVNNEYKSGFFNMDQRIVQLTPMFMHTQTLKYDWDLYHLTKEMGPQEVRVLLASYLSDKKEVKDWMDWDKRKFVAMFMHQAGWHQEAQKDLDALVKEYPDKKEEVADLRASIKKILADIFVEDIERAFKAGQHNLVQERLAFYGKENMAPLVNEKNLLFAQELKNKYESQNEKIAQAKTTLRELEKRVTTSDKQSWTKAVELILAELNYDTLARLDTFLSFGQQHLREALDKDRPSQTPEEVLALAISGWLLGNSSALPDVNNARLLLRIREMVLEYQKTENTVTRSKLLASVFQSSNLSVDVLAGVIKNLPPPFPYEITKTGTDAKKKSDPVIAKDQNPPSEIVKLDIDIADSPGGSYYLRLPPDYHHHRAFPVLLLLHGSREKPDVMLQRMSELAAQNGFILAAPLWSGSRGSGIYGFTAREHAVVMDTLRDMRRRFQVDSDRVFLFGWEQGADAALDIGMSHPDQFAGVLPMCGLPRYYCAERNRYSSNAQYLPFYLVDGDRDGANPTGIRILFKEWISNNYPALYVEYKGRGQEWFVGELPRMFDWMTRKKRHQPMREMGRRHTGGLVGEEFRTMRECDNRFYWLSTDEIDPRYINSTSSWVRNIPPATMQAAISVGNDLITKAGQKEAKIFTQINIQTKGLKQLTLWLAPNMVDFTKPIRIRINGSTTGSDRIIPPNPAVLLDDFSYNGDRQRLYFAKVAMKF